MTPDPQALRGGNDDILFYRSYTHIIGGVGIITLVLVVFMAGRGKEASMTYFFAERGSQRIRPGLKGTVMEIWKIYGLYTLAAIICLYIAGMSLFDSIIHAFSAMSTGGFSSRAESIGYYNSPLIEAICMFFMIMGAISFLLHYRIFNGYLNELYKSIEAKYMLALIIYPAFFISFLLYYQSGEVGGVATTFSSNIRNFLHSLRLASFQVISALTCTGFSTANAGSWPQAARTTLMILMYIGGFYGSTAGGIKLLRLIIVVQAIMHIIKKMMLPKTAVLTMKMDGKLIDNEQIIYVLGFCMLYLMVAVGGALIFMLLGYDALTSLSLTLSAMGNVGIVYVTGNAWFHMAVIGKITLALLMWIGRLEIFPILMLLTPIYLGERK